MIGTALIIMAKQPLVGSTKTRLCPPLEPAEAAVVYEALLLDTIELCSDLDGIHLAVAVTPPSAVGYFESITPSGATLIPVDCPDIGHCLQQVIGQLLESGYDKVLALNSDGPSLPAAYIYQAVYNLNHHEMVLGPGEDGGYYLIGLKRLHKDLFIEIDWSTPRVLPQTISKIEMLGLDSVMLPYWYDIDTWDDLLRLKDELRRLPSELLPNTRRFFSSYKSIERGL